jgi:hypothetical protein
MKVIIHLCMRLPTCTLEFQAPHFIGFVEKEGHMEAYGFPWEVPQGYTVFSTIKTDVALDWARITALAVAGLEEQKRRTRGEAEKKCTELEGTIQSFLALGAPPDET